MDLLVVTIVITIIKILEIGLLLLAGIGLMLLRLGWLVGLWVLPLLLLVVLLVLAALQEIKNN
jgi:fatty acid desaturase